MRTKVCLVCLPFYNHVFSPPIQLAYLKAYLQQSDLLEVKVLDLESYYFRSPLMNGYVDLYWYKIFNAETAITDEIRRVLDGAVDLILAEDPAMVGFSTASCNFLFTRYVSQRIKALRPGIFIVYGGLSFCYRPAMIKSVVDFHRTYPDVDCIVMNEGEAALRDVAESYARGQRPPLCKGTTVRNGDTVVDCGPREFIPDIDCIPFPDYSDFRKEDYLADYIRILFTRGCVGRCVFCSDNYFMSARLRSARNIVDEIILRKSQGYTRFQSVDLCINPSVPRLEETCRLMIHEAVNVEFIFAQFRHSLFLSRQTFSLLRQAGFHTVSFGTETGSPRILELMNKGIDRMIAQRNIRDARAEGLSVILFLMVGFPGETEDTFLQTLEWIRANADYISAVKHVMPVTVNYGSVLYENAQAYGLDPSSLGGSPDSWQTSDGSNTRSWRYDLVERMMRHLKACGIPIVDFDYGNIAVPAQRASVVCKPEERERIWAEARKHFHARLTFLRQPRETETSMIFSMRIENTGKQKWPSGGNNPFRIGCRLAESRQNAVFQEFRMNLPSDIEPGQSFETDFFIERRHFNKHGQVRVKFDIVREELFWFEDIGSTPLVSEVSY